MHEVKANVCTPFGKAILFCIKLSFSAHPGKESGDFLSKCAGFRTIQPDFRGTLTKKQRILYYCEREGPVGRYRKGRCRMTLKKCFGFIRPRMESCRNASDRAKPAFLPCIPSMMRCLILCSGSKIFRLDNKRKGVNL